MNWQTIAFDWNQVRAFLATVEEGSLSGAARVTGLTQPTIGRQVSALETELGVTLFQRTGRKMLLTEPGRELLDHVRDMADAASRISLTAAGQSSSVEGKVRITASDVFSAFMLPKVLPRIAQVAPMLHIDLIAANDIRDLVQREADIAIRHVRPEQPDLIAKLVGEATGHFFAAPSYFERMGRPTSKADLSNHRFIGFGDDGGMINYLKGVDIHLKADNFRFSSTSGIASWEMAKMGLGIGAMSEQIGILTPEVEHALPTMDPIRFPVWLATHRELHTSRRIRLVFDILAEFLADQYPAA